MADDAIQTVGRLLTTLSRAVREEFSSKPGEPVPEGPHFVYELNPTLFLGRRGRGPLRIAWDTNLLIDYFDHGRELWEGASLPASLPGAYGEELEGLQFVIALWAIRDIRFHIPSRALKDARARLSPERAAERSRAFREFAAALSLVEWDEPERRDGPPLLLPDRAFRRALRDLPAGSDRELVEEAVTSGMHVFMTRDLGILKRGDALRPFGLLLASPLDVLQELTASGALHCLLHPRFAYWPFPDLQRVSHLIRAFGI